MKNQFAFLPLSNVISNVILLPREAKEKRNPFVIVNTDNDRGLYIKNLEKEIAKYKNLISADGERLFHEIETNNLIVFGDNPNFDYRIDMEYLMLHPLVGRNVKIYDLVEDYSKIVRRLSTYCKSNGIKRKTTYRDDDYAVECRVVRTPKSNWISRIKQQANECPLFAAQNYVARPLTKKTLVNVYSKPDINVEKITVHAYWVKIGYNSYDIFVDLSGNESIALEDGQKLFVETDRFGRRYLAV